MGYLKESFNLSHYWVYFVIYQDAIDYFFVVTAPKDAEVTKDLYLSRTPPSSSFTGQTQDSFLFFNSSSERSKFIWFVSASIEITSHL